MAAKKKAVEAAEEVQAEEKEPVAPKNDNPALEACKKAAALIDPNGKRHVPSGTPGAYQEALTVLYSAIDAEG